MLVHFCLPPKKQRQISTKLDVTVFSSHSNIIAGLKWATTGSDDHNKREQQHRKEFFKMPDGITLAYETF